MTKALLRSWIPNSFQKERLETEFARPMKATTSSTLRILMRRIEIKQHLSQLSPSQMEPPSGIKYARAAGILRVTILI